MTYDCLLEREAWLGGGGGGLRRGTTHGTIYIYTHTHTFNIKNSAEHVSNGYTLCSHHSTCQYHILHVVVLSPRPSRDEALGLSILASDPHFPKIPPERFWV